MNRRTARWHSPSPRPASRTSADESSSNRAVYARAARDESALSRAAGTLRIARASNSLGVFARNHPSFTATTHTAAQNVHETDCDTRSIAMSKFKKVTHVFAVALAAAATFVVTPAGKA